jgi:hypothetical protein
VLSKIEFSRSLTSPCELGLTTDHCNLSVKKAEVKED